MSEKSKSAHSALTKHVTRFTRDVWVHEANDKIDKRPTTEQAHKQCETPARRLRNVPPQNLTNILTFFILFFSSNPVWDRVLFCLVSFYVFRACIGAVVLFPRFDRVIETEQQ